MPTIKEINDSLKLYKAKLFTKKVWFNKGISFVISLLIVLSLSLPMYFWAINTKTPIYDSWFIRINITLNSGVSFGILKGKTLAIIFIQLFSLIMLLIAFFLVLKWYYSFCILISLHGAVFNFLDRLIDANVPSLGIPKQNSVLDYFQFNMFGTQSAIFNFPDIFILMGIISISLIFLIESFKGKENIKHDI